MSPPRAPRANATTRAPRPLDSARPPRAPRANATGRAPRPLDSARPSRDAARAPRRLRARIDAARLARRDRSRIAIFLTVVAVALGLIGLRLGDLQIVQAPHWRGEARSQSSATIVIPASRGTLFARDLRDLALSVPRDAVYADPTLVEDRQYYADALAPLLKVPASELFAAMAPKQVKVGTKLVPSQYAPLATAIPADVAEQIAAMRFPGIYTRTEPQREYPDGTLAAAVLGYTVPDVQGPKGATGLELQYNDVLTGKPGVVEARRDANGTEFPAPDAVGVRSQPGRDLVLSLDEGIQYRAEQSLLDQVQAQQARGGMAAVLDLRTGDVLAMATVVGAANGKPAHVATAYEANAPLTFTYNPGSVMKIVPISTAIESQCVTPSSTFSVPAAIRNGPFTIRDDEAHPEEPMTVDDILVQSSNVGTTLVTRKCFRPTTLDAALRRYGFGAKTGIDFPLDDAGVLIPPDRYYDSGLASNAIGYSLLATPMQVLDAYATVARGGVAIRPRFVRAYVDAKGKTVNLPVRTAARVISPNTATTMQSFFADVVQRGTGPCAAVEGYRIGGKTGTAQKQVGGGYSAAAPVATFVGFGGGDRPALAAIVVMDEPREVYGARAAAPVFSEVMRYALAQRHVPPLATGPGPTPWDQAAESARRKGNTCAVPHGDALQSLLTRLTAPSTTTTTATTTTTGTTTATNGAATKGAATRRTTTSSATTTTTVPFAPTTTLAPARPGHP